MSEAYDEAMVELRELWLEMRNQSEENHYGFFLGGDPRRFSPDPEGCTPEELAAHKEACAQWDSGNKTDSHMPQCLRGDPNKVGFGIGVTVIEDPVCADVAERLGRILDRLERE